MVLPDHIQRLFWAKVKKTDNCWEWTAATWGKGYGVYRHKNKSRSAHRLSYEIANGPIPEGLLVLHKCDNPKCVRPDHLWLGTHADNMADCVRKGRNAKGERQRLAVLGRVPSGETHWTHRDPNKVPRGEQSGKTPLKERQVREMRDRYAQGGVLMRELAAEYGISLAGVHKIIHRLNWAHIA